VPPGSPGTGPSTPPLPARPWGPLEGKTPCPAPGAGPGSDPGEASMARQRCRAVHSALAALDEKYRAVLVLCHLLQLSYREAAESLDLEEKTVKSRLFSARQLLRENLEALGHVG